MSVVAISANFFSIGTYQSKTNAVELFLGDSKVFNFNITPDNEYFDTEEEKKIVKIFQDDTNEKAWHDSEKRSDLRTAIAKMVLFQLEKEIGPVEDWNTCIDAGQTDRRAKLFKILSIIISECCRILLRANKSDKYEEWLNLETPQGRLDLFWISWMASTFGDWFAHPDFVGRRESNLSGIPSAVNYEKQNFKGVLSQQIYFTIISRLRGGSWELDSYNYYTGKYVFWTIQDKLSEKQLQRWLNEDSEGDFLVFTNKFTPPHIYPVVGNSDHVSKEISIDDFLNGDLLNLSCNNGLTFKALDGDTKSPTVQPTVRSVKYNFLFHNKGNSSKSKSFKIDSDKLYAFQVSRTGTPQLLDLTGNSQFNF